MAKILNAVVGIIYCGDEFLILQKKGAWIGWQFVQGAIDPGETAEQAVLREVREETGLTKTEITKKLDFKSDYWFVWEKEKIHKFLTYFLVKGNKEEPIKLSEEHSEYKWCSYEETLKEIKFNKELFQKAHGELKKLK
jgi:8-oxo-dGTP pyrophosphatase MutT (NUDIX family)